MTKEKLQYKKTTIELYELVEIFLEKYYSQLSKEEIRTKLFQHIIDYPKENILNFNTEDFEDILETSYEAKKLNI